MRGVVDCLYALNMMGRKKEEGEGREKNQYGREA